MWKAAFDRNRAGQQQSGVRRYRILRPIDDPNYIMVDLEFDSSHEAEGSSCRDAPSVGTAASSGGLVGSPPARIVEVVRTREY
jgi:hypothetical protein